MQKDWKYAEPVMNYRVGKIIHILSAFMLAVIVVGCRSEKKDEYTVAMENREEFEN